MKSTEADLIKLDPELARFYIELEDKPYPIDSDLACYYKEQSLIIMQMQQQPLAKED